MSGCKKCGGEVFISQLNSYDVYVLEDDELQYMDTELIDEKVKLRCQDCGTRLKVKEFCTLIREK